MAEAAKSTPRIEKKEITVKISPSILFYALAIAAALFLLQKLKSIIIILFIAYIISVGLNKAINKLQHKYGWRRGVAAGVSYVLFVVVLVSFLSFVVPPLASESVVLLNTLNKSLDNGSFFGVELNFDGLSKILNVFGSSVAQAFNVISSTFSGVFIAITTLIVSFYMTLDRPRLLEQATQLTKNNRQARTLRDFFIEVDEQLGNWLRSEIILMTIIGALTFVAAVIIGVPYALPLAIFAGLMEIVPNIGPTITAIVAGLIAYFSLGWGGAAGMIVASIIIQQLENSLIVPRVMKSNVGLNALTSIIGILSGAALFGIIGALLAIPVIIVGRSLYIAWDKNH